MQGEGGGVGHRLCRVTYERLDGRRKKKQKEEGKASRVSGWMGKKRGQRHAPREQEWARLAREREKKLRRAEF